MRANIDRWTWDLLLVERRLSGRPRSRDSSTECSYCSFISDYQAELLRTHQFVPRGHAGTRLYAQKSKVLAVVDVSFGRTRH